MKGKNGKSSAMRGGGLARKGVGVALKGGGIARKGTGSDATPGGKVEKMAMGGKPGESAMAKAEASRSMSRAASSPRDGGFAGSGKSAGGVGSGGGKSDPMVRNDFRQVPLGALPGRGGVAGDARPFRGPTTLPMPIGKSKSNGQYPASNRTAKGSLQGSITGKDQSRLASGGPVKMTAGSGSGSGRLEKVAAHKAAKRIPATGLKKGGKVKGK